MYNNYEKKFPSTTKMTDGTYLKLLIIQVICLSFDITRSLKKPINLTFIITLIEHESTVWITQNVSTPK